MTPEEPMMSEPRVEAMRRILAQQVRDEPELRRKRRRQKFVLWGGVGALTVGLATTGATMLLNEAEVTDRSIVHCLSSTTPNLDGSYPGSAATIAESEGPGRVDDALALCTQMWQQGVLSTDVDPTAPTQEGEDAAVPALQVCVMRDGTAAVVPGESDSTCQMVGMAPLDG
ncbi:hypothetical protein [Rathayibacter sp. SD072]|uniref:hypothetical protein n=1 Tax=Rathayibacter sp. SD072 TaxID=2781731 RepID=UPI001A96EFD6|nr:hypothetical protein [Rathayibacter sp. SD072]MBO0982689.1 hypothetical protein [Rathayibacter sp. SD072]